MMRKSKEKKKDEIQIPIFLSQTLRVGVILVAGQIGKKYNEDEDLFKKTPISLECCWDHWHRRCLNRRDDMSHILNDINVAEEKTLKDSLYDPLSFYDNRKVLEPRLNEAKVKAIFLYYAFNRLVSIAWRLRDIWNPKTSPSEREELYYQIERRRKELAYIFMLPLDEIFLDHETDEYLHSAFGKPMPNTIKHRKLKAIFKKTREQEQ